jgi:hypothetical protein
MPLDTMRNFFGIGVLILLVPSAFPGCVTWDPPREPSPDRPAPPGDAGPLDGEPAKSLSQISHPSAGPGDPPKAGFAVCLRARKASGEERRRRDMTENIAEEERQSITPPQPAEARRGIGIGSKRISAIGYGRSPFFGAGDRSPKARSSGVISDSY